MALRKELLSKSLKKGRTQAVSVLNELSEAAGFPPPVYEYEAGGSTKRRSHFFRVRFRVPPFLDVDGFAPNITGAGKCTSKQFAKSLAALQVVHRLEEELSIGRDKLRTHLEDYKNQQAAEKEKLENLLAEGERVPDVSWSAIPIDPSLSAAVPASREGRISFLTHTSTGDGTCSRALLMAKAMTLASENGLPEIQMHANQTDEGVTQKYANIRPQTDLINAHNGAVGEFSFGVDYNTTVKLALQAAFIKTATTTRFLLDWIKESNRLKKKKIAHRKRYRGNAKLLAKTPKPKSSFQDLLDSIELDTTMIKNPKSAALLEALLKQPESSFGMAKLSVQWPSKQQFKAVTELIEEKFGETSSVSELWEPKRQQQRHNNITSGHYDWEYQNRRLQERIENFRQAQAKTPLPIDTIVQDDYDADVTILCGGTGSGKTTRYPLMVSLYDSNLRQLVEAHLHQFVADQHEHEQHVQRLQKMVVAQPRRLACQAAAKRVALEQGYNLEQDNHDCPIGYSIRFESRPSDPLQDRTIDFQTIGVVLATASSDPLLSHITHLVIDEVHERNADMDLLLSLARSIQIQRKHHPTLPPLKIILMSATLDASQWEDYFRQDPEIEVAQVSVPDATRFPIDIVHLGDNEFPLQPNKRRRSRLSDDELWKYTAHLVMHIVNQGSLNDGGSILCFLPGMEEIETVQRMLAQSLRKSPVPTKPKILILHSSVSSSRQARIFEPGPKCILSTNIAETSVTIPDVKFIVDPGRERQSMMLEDNSLVSENATVVGSQLVTVDIAQSAAKQRAGRAGRVAPGTCYRLYTQEDHANLPVFTKPEMLRMDLAQLVLHSISLCDPKRGGDPLGLISGAPDPPPNHKLQQAVSSLVEQGLVAFDPDSESDSDSEDLLLEEDRESLDSDQNDDLKSGESVQDIQGKELVKNQPRLTHLGKMVSTIPSSPRTGRMLMLGLALGAVESALTIAALLSVPKVFSTYQQQSRGGYSNDKLPETCSDVIEQVQKFEIYERLGNDDKRRFKGGREHAQVSRVRRQLAKTLGDLIVAKEGEGNRQQPLRHWNANGDRVGAQAALICAATQHVACLVDGRGAFATRDCAGTARMHPSSVNFSHDRRSHWYVYNELRKTKTSFLHVTTATSPLELALFSNGGSRSKLDDDIEELRKMLKWTHLADQWVPVCMATQAKRSVQVFCRLKEILNHDILNEVSRDPRSYRANEDYKKLIALVMAAVELQRREL